MEETELILICLVAVALLAIVARKIRIPYPILLTVGGVVLALIPGLPTIHLKPKLVFDLFLPPLLYPAAIFTSWRDFRANLRSILPMAIVLVLVTMTVTAYLFHHLVGLPLAVGFVFGAIISPPDAVAALAVTQNLRVPRKIIVILEGESLVNDATSFISFRFAVAAVMTGTFSLAQASLQFLFVAAGGICVGVAVGWLIVQLQKRLDDPPVQTLLMARPADFERAHASDSVPSLGNGHVHLERNTFHAHRASTAAGCQSPRSGHGDSRGLAGYRVCCNARAGPFPLGVRGHLLPASAEPNIPP